MLNRIIVVAFLIITGVSFAQTPEPEPVTGSISVTTRPDGATVFLDGKEAGRSPMQIQNVKPGRHIVSAQAKGHIEARSMVMVGPDGKEPVDLTLEPVTGMILLESTPAGADITLNGAHAGQTPALLKNLPLGKSRIELQLNGYKSQALEHMVSDQRPQLVRTTLKSNLAALNIRTTPGGATITLDGISQGTSPATIDGIEAGVHTLSITKKGFENHESSITLQAGGETKVVNVTLKEVPASIRVVTIPVGARIYLNNRFEGLSPIDLKDLTSGDYRIRAEKKGTDPMARTVTLKAGESLTEEFRLSTNTGILQLTTEPANCDVFVDGAKIGTTKALEGGGNVSEPLEIDTILEGDHVLQISRSGYVARKIKFTLKKDEARPVHVKLQRRFIPTHKVYRSGSSSVTGILLDPASNGNVRLETAPGIILEIPTSDIRRVSPLDAE